MHCFILHCSWTKAAHKFTSSHWPHPQAVNQCHCPPARWMLWQQEPINILILHNHKSSTEGERKAVISWGFQSSSAGDATDKIWIVPKPHRGALGTAPGLLPCAGGKVIFLSCTKTPKQSKVCPDWISLQSWQSKQMQIVLLSFTTARTWNYHVQVRGAVGNFWQWEEKLAMS